MCGRSDRCASGATRHEPPRCSHDRCVPCPHTARHTPPREEEKADLSQGARKLDGKNDFGLEQWKWYAMPLADIVQSDVDVSFRACPDDNFNALFEVQNGNRSGDAPWRLFTVREPAIGFVPRLAIMAYRVWMRRVILQCTVVGESLHPF